MSKMSKTYIVHLPERYIEKRPDGDEWLQLPVNVSGHDLMIKTVIPLTPYTEPDLDAVRNEAYKEAYDKGYQDAVMKIGSNEQAIAEKAYQGGLIDAWDAAKKIVLSKESGGLFDFDSVKAVFGCGTFLALKKYSASEAIEKIRQYEQEQEVIKAGDEVNGKGGRGTITKISDDGDHFNVMWENGSTGYYMREDFKKTGRHFSEIAEVLRKMQEEKE